jgi:hypothetical protein
MGGKKESIQAKFKKMDTFKEPVKLNYDGGRTFFATKTGAFFSVIEVTLVILFAVQRLLVMTGRDNTSIRQYYEFNENFRSYGSQNGLSFAFAIGAQ